MDAEKKDQNGRVIEKAPIAYSMGTVRKWIRESCGLSQVTESDDELRQVMVKAGARTYCERLKIAGRNQYVVYNGHPDLDTVVTNAAEEARKMLRAHLKEAPI